MFYEIVMLLSLYGLSLFSWLLGSKKCPVNGFEKWDKKWDKIFKKPENGVKTAILISKIRIFRSNSEPVNPSVVGSSLTGAALNMESRPNFIYFIFSVCLICLYSFLHAFFAVFRGRTAEFFLETRAEIKLIFKPRAIGDFHDRIVRFRQPEKRGVEFALVGVGDGRNARNALEFPQKRGFGKGARFGKPTEREMLVEAKFDEIERGGNFLPFAAARRFFRFVFFVRLLRFGNAAEKLQQNAAAERFFALGFRGSQCGNQPAEKLVNFFAFFYFDNRRVQTRIEQDFPRANTVEMHPADCAVGRRERLVVLPFAGDVDDTMRIADGAFFARARYREFSAVGVNQLKIFSAAFAQGVRRLRACPVAADTGVVDVEIVAVFAVRDIVVCEIFGDHIINIIRFIWSLSTKNCRYFIYF